jgi:two-component system, chemotaxis family, CheB/CheR fusion protein
MLVLFEPADSGSASAGRKGRPSANQRRQESREILRLEQELAATRDYLQAVQEQYDAAGEELQSLSEETQSANEELQSINEELETSKEELESTNEELTTVNEWMANRNAELSRLNSDIINLQSSINVPIVLVGRDLAIRRFTQPAEKLFNLLASDVGRPLGVIRHNLNFAGLEQLVSEVIDTVAGQEREVRDREGCWFLLRVRPYLTVENAIDGAVILLVDTTNQKKSEEAKGRLAAIVEYSEDAIISKDLNGIITTWNHGAEKLFGYTAQEAIGRPVSILAPPGRENEMMEILERIRRRQNVEHYDTVRLRKDGTPLDISLAVSPIFDANGEIIGASKIARDITSRKVAEDERAALLIREQSARAEAETANRLKDEFLALVSHEVRTPLNAIVGWVHLLRAGKPSDDQIEKALESIDRNASAQGEIINELLDTSRIITGKLRMESKALQITSIIESALEIMRPAAEAKSITVETDLDCHAGPVWGDSARLQQVLWNLLSNAIKFTPRGGRVDVGCRQSETNVVITIKDSGEGMDQEFLPYAFDRFRQADASTARIHAGLGLGLSIVRNIVEMHGGTVFAESEGKRRGSIFTVTLPAMTMPNLSRGSTKPGGQQPKSEVTAPPIQLARLDGLLILVVEDDEDTRELLKVALTSSGAEAIVCASSVEALAHIERRRPDCIISDVGLPGEDGYEFMKKLRLLSRRNGGQIPAIALSGFAGSRHRGLADSAGYQVHLAKPVELDQLTAEIARLVGEKR